MKLNFEHGRKRYNPDGPSAEERALERFTELMILC